MQPGESGKIPVKLGTKKAGGPMSKTVTVNTNVDGKNATIQLKVKGEVWQPVQVTPRSAAFGRITAEKANAGLVRKLTIVNNVKGELKLTDIQSTSPLFSASIAPLEAGKKYELTVKLVPPLKQGNNTGKIVLQTGLSDIPKLEIPTYAYVTAPVDVTPTQLALPENRKAPLKRQFYVRSNTKKPIKISDLKASNPLLKLELNDIKDGLTYRLTVDVPVDYKPASAGGDRITFKTDNPTVPEISVPITVRAARKPNIARRTPGKATPGKFNPVTIGAQKNKKKPTITNKATPKSTKPTKAVPAGN